MPFLTISLALVGRSNADFVCSSDEPGALVSGSTAECCQSLKSKLALSLARNVPEPLPSYTTDHLLI